MSIFIIALAVFGAAVVFWIIGVFRDGRKERERVREFQRDVARQERTLAEDAEAWKRGEPPVRIETDIEVDSHAYRRAHKDDDSTTTLPILPPGVGA